MVSNDGSSLNISVASANWPTMTCKKSISRSWVSKEAYFDIGTVFDSLGKLFGASNKKCDIPIDGDGFSDNVKAQWARWPKN